MPTKGKMTPGPWEAVELGYTDGPHVPGCFKVMHAGTRQWVASQVTPRDARAIACLPEVIEAARMLCVNVDAMQLKPTIVSTAHLRRILARIDGEGA